MNDELLTKVRPFGYPTFPIAKVKSRMPFSKIHDLCMTSLEPAWDNECVDMQGVTAFVYVSIIKADIFILK